MALDPCVAEAVAAASADDLDRLLALIRQRRDMLARVNAATLDEGTDVRTSGLSPKFLNGLTGYIEKVGSGRTSRMDVLLDERSTDVLRWQGSPRFHIPTEARRYLLRGVPVQCLTRVEAKAEVV